jgi:hypothetical protein
MVPAEVVHVPPLAVSVTLTVVRAHNVVALAVMGLTAGIGTTVTTLVAATTLQLLDTV